MFHNKDNIDNLIRKLNQSCKVISLIYNNNGMHPEKKKTIFGQNKEFATYFLVLSLTILSIYVAY
jgi:hypothetical protein